jgi:hypothetical protein
MDTVRIQPRRRGDWTSAFVPDIEYMMSCNNGLKSEKKCYIADAVNSIM